MSFKKFTRFLNRVSETRKDENAKCGFRYFCMDGENETPFCNRYTSETVDGLKANDRGAIGACMDIDRFGYPVIVKRKGKKHFHYRCSL